jgi:hypothetical protein
LDSPDDVFGGHDEKGTDAIGSPGSFEIYADSECFRCAKITERKTAELLYMSSQWDFYYCYRCRGWFKKPFNEKHVVLPVTDRKVIKHLTWMYTSHMEALYENRKMLERMESVWRGLERRLSHV